MKWMIALTLTGSTLIGSAAITTVEAQSFTPEITTSTVAVYGDVLPTFEEYRQIKIEAHKAKVRAHKLWVQKKRERELQRAVELVLDRVGKTPYVFSGSSPSGWDCSGLVVWMYSKLGVELPHSASAQLHVGKRTNHPIPGDIVVWGGGYHSGIYLGNGKTVNALNPNVDTQITDINYVAGEVVYIHVY